MGKKVFLTISIIAAIFLPAAAVRAAETQRFPIQIVHSGFDKTKGVFFVLIDKGGAAGIAPGDRLKIFFDKNMIGDLYIKTVMPGNSAGEFTPAEGRPCPKPGATVEAMIVVHQAIAAQKTPQSAPGVEKTAEKAEKTPTAASKIPGLATQPSNEISAGDILLLTVPGGDKSPLYISVPTSGAIAIPQLGDIRAAGATTDELAALVNRKIKEENLSFPTPISISKTNGKLVRVNGEVGKPGEYLVDAGARVSDILALSGGLTSNASESGGILFKKSGEVVPVDLKSIKANPLGKTDPQLSTEDFLLIPAGQLPTIRIVLVGRLTNPGVYVLERDNPSLLNLLFNSGGMLPDAAADKTLIIRAVNGAVQIMPVDCSGVVSGKIESDYQLQDGDLVYIPDSSTNIAELSKSDFVLNNILPAININWFLQRFNDNWKSPGQR